MATINQNIVKSTVRIVCDNGIGTGFFFVFLDKEDPTKGRPLIVTNKHVVEGAQQVHLRLNLKPNKNNLPFFDVLIKDVSQLFLHHPDPEVDLCALPLATVYGELNKHGYELDNFFFNEADFKDVQSLMPIEDIYMTGYPNGLWDEVNNKPITRKGITASDVNLNWNGKNQFMIDMACFGGSSGSPVYLMNEGSYATEDGIAIGTRFKLLGILFAGPIFHVDGEVEIVEVPTSITAVSRTGVMMNLGFVVKANELLGFKPFLGI